MTFAGSFVGEIAAVSTAACWTMSSLWFAFATRRATGIATNQFRLLAALPCLCLLHLLLEGALWPALPATRLWQLAASGLAGLVLGDIGYFYALGVIGPRLASVLMATWPVMATAIQWAWRGDAPTAAMAGGIAATTAGVVLVVLRSGDGEQWQRGARPWQVRLAMGGGLLGALGQATGSVLVAAATVHDDALPAGVPGVSAALVRMATAGIGITAAAALRGRAFAFVRVLQDRRALGSALGGTLFGPILGVWLSMVALANAHVDIASALIATTPVFMMPVAKLAYGARIGARGLCGTLLAVAGAAVLLLGRR
jgi:drug/metabolite transporter (DMT)-like permease